MIIEPLGEKHFIDKDHGFVNLRNQTGSQCGAPGGPSKLQVNWSVVLDPRRTFPTSGKLARSVGPQEDLKNIRYTGP